MIQRMSAEKIKNAAKSKIVVLLGARQVGKTTLLKSLFDSDSLLWLNGDEIDVQNLFETISAERFKAYLGTKKIVVIDEAQRISNIGLRLKVLADSLPDIQVYATGSSSFDLANNVNEPLTGRKREFRLFPLSFAELVNHSDLLTDKRNIGLSENRLDILSVTQPSRPKLFHQHYFDLRAFALHGFHIFRYLLGRFLAHMPSP